MKKVISVFLILMLLLSLCSCGNNTENTVENNVENNKVPQATENSTNADKIEFEEPLLIWEDNNIKIEIDSFYQEFFNWGNKEPAMEKGISLRFYNKTDYYVHIQMQEAYLGMEAVAIVHSGGSETPAPGKVATHNCIIQNGVGINTTALDSMDALYQLEGRFYVGINHDANDNTIDESYKIDFSLPSIINGEHTQSYGSEDSITEQTEVIYEIGDTVSTDTVEFTLSGFNYVYHLNPSSYAEKDDISGGSLGPGTDMVFANPEYTITNTSKNAIDAHNVVEFSIDYNDGFIFNMYDHISYLVDSPSLTRKLIGKGTSQGVAMTLSPLSSETYEMYFVANARIETDTDSSLLLKVILDSSNGIEEFVFRIR